jgi:hypothetical protein
MGRIPGISSQITYSTSAPNKVKSQAVFNPHGKKSRKLRCRKQDGEQAELGAGGALLAPGPQARTL